MDDRCSLSYLLRTGHVGYSFSLRVGRVYGACGEAMWTWSLYALQIQGLGKGNRLTDWGDVACALNEEIGRNPSCELENDSPGLDRPGMTVRVKGPGSLVSESGHIEVGGNHTRSKIYMRVYIYKMNTQ